MPRRRPPREHLGRVLAALAVAGFALTGLAGTTDATATSGHALAGNTFTTRTACSAGTAFPGSVQSLGPTLYWRFSEAAGATTVADSSGNGNTGTVRTTGPPANRVALGAASPIWCDTTGGALQQPAVGRGAVNAGTVVWTTPRVAPGPNTFTIMAWVKVPAGLATGGRIIGFSNADTGRSTRYDRHLFVDNQGRAVFGIYPGSALVLRSTSLVNDGAAHFVVGTLGPGGGSLYVDGVVQGSDPSWTVGQNYAGYWRVGWDNLAGWGPSGDPNNPTNFGLGGIIDEAAVFEGQALTAAQVAALHAENHW